MGVWGLGVEVWGKGTDLGLLAKGQRGLTPRILAVFWLYGTAMAGCIGLL